MLTLFKVLLTAILLVGMLLVSGFGVDVAFGCDSNGCPPGTVQNVYGDGSKVWSECDPIGVAGQGYIGTVGQTTMTKDGPEWDNDGIHPGEGGLADPVGDDKPIKTKTLEVK